MAVNFLPADTKNAFAVPRIVVSEEETIAPSGSKAEPAAGPWFYNTQNRLNSELFECITWAGALRNENDRVTLECSEIHFMHL